MKTIQWILIGSRLFVLTCVLTVLGLVPCPFQGVGAAETGPGRPPAVPLVACDPYFSVWSFSDRLTDDVTRHWTGKRQALSSLIRVDGKAFHLMGTGPEGVPALPQVGLLVLPTRTIYDFEGPEAHVTLTFL